MKKAELVGVLRRYADGYTGGRKGQGTLARFLAHYFGQLEISADQEHDFWRIEPYIPQLLLGAMEAFGTSEDETVRRLRTRYQEELGQSFIDPADIWGSGVEQALTVHSLGSLFKEAIGADWLADKIDMVLGAERHLLQQVFYKFVDRVFRRGLFQLANELPQRGLSGAFGETTLRTYMSGGRFMLTFARPGELAEHSVSFVCRDDSPLGLGGGVQSVYTDLPTALSMINDVIAGWPDDRAAQAEVLRPNAGITLG